MNKQILLNEIERAHQDMTRWLAALSDDEKTAPILNEGWSVKDSLAHLIAWEKMTLDWLARSLQGEQVKRFVEGFQYDTEAEREAVMEKLNTHLYEQNKNRPLPEVMQDFRATHRAIFDFVAQMNENDIFDPNRFAWRNGSPAFDMLAGNTYEHYDEHRQWILEALEQR
ncbi:ClbS/DfsB family four-helix bundle protein [Anaerolineae bacterium CFX7]|nr:ClbS/DfsB family four-helix bundle protein [Anaerolineae bacterium CFX7]